MYRYEQQLMTMDNQSFNMDQVQFNMENLENTTAMVQAMKEASSVMQEKFKAPEMDIDTILDMQDDMAELLEESNEINEVLGQDYGIGEAIDEDDLMAELDMLGGDMDMGAMDSVGGMPAVIKQSLCPMHTLRRDHGPLQAPVYYPEDPGPPIEAAPTGLNEFGLPDAPTGVQPMPAQQF